MQKKINLGSLEICNSAYVFAKLQKRNIHTFQLLFPTEINARGSKTQHRLIPFTQITITGTVHQLIKSFAQFIE